MLFNGQVFAQNNIPANYIPSLMGIQFTEPLVIMSLLGFLITIFKISKKEVDITRILLTMAWFLLPVVYTMANQPTLYSNFRQFFFITPPLFIFSGFSIEWILDRIRNSWFRFVVLLLILLPGIYQIIQLHPYQYIYYNSFAGGVEGAAGDYELDYWNLAYKDAMDYVNEHIPEGSNILVWKNNSLGEVYAEKEFNFQAHTAVPESEYSNYDYAIIPTAWHADISAFEAYPVVHTVKVDSVDLVAIVKINETAGP